MLYSEHLTPPWWMWALALAGCAMLSIAYGAGLGLPAGFLTFVVSGAGVCWCLWLTSPLIAVTDAELWAGHAHLPLSAIGVIGTLDPEAMQATRRQDADPSAFSVVRTLTTATAVIAEVSDQRDPHPYWLVSSRDPMKLAECIRSARQSALASYDQH